MVGGWSKGSTLNAEGWNYCTWINIGWCIQVLPTKNNIYLSLQFFKTFIHKFTVIKLSTIIKLCKLSCCFMYKQKWKAFNSFEKGHLQCICHGVDHSQWLPQFAAEVCVHRFNSSLTPAPVPRPPSLSRTGTQAHFSYFPGYEFANICANLASSRLELGYLFRRDLGHVWKLQCCFRRGHRGLFNDVRNARRGPLARANLRWMHRLPFQMVMVTVAHLRFASIRGTIVLRREKTE